MFSSVLCLAYVYICVYIFWIFSLLINIMENMDIGFFAFNFSHICHSAKQIEGLNKC